MFCLGNRASINTLLRLLLNSKTASILLLAIGFLGLKITPLQAQSVIPANDGVGTKVQQNQGAIGIDGGTRSQNNLFHSFEKFGLSEGETAIFLSDPEISNILGRVVGNEASVINGLLQVNSNTNLFLMNPAGIIFGDNAQLNVGGDFTATTATSIGFGNGNFFNAYGDNDFSTLSGNPFQFSFDTSDPNAVPGTIINRGNLAIAGDVNLIGGSVVSTGTISSTQGDITISSVPNSSLLTIEQEGNLLSLEIDPPRNAAGEILPFNAVDLPELLTGSVLVNEVTGENVTINSNEGKVFVGTEQAFASSSSLPAVEPFDGEIVANSQLTFAGEEILITEGITVIGENVIFPSNTEEQDLQDLSFQTLNEDGTTEGEVVGIDLDGDGIPDVPIGITPPDEPDEPDETVEPSDEVISQVNSDVLNQNTEIATIESIEQLENTTITYQPQAQDPQAVLARQITTLDSNFTNDYEDYYAYNQTDAQSGADLASNPTATPNLNFVENEEELEVSLAQIQQTLKKIETATGANPAIIYAAFYPTTIASNRSQPSILPQPDDELELVVITADKEPIRQRVEGAERIKVQQIANRFTDSIFYELPESEYLPASQQLYQWLVQPLAADLETREIDNLVFILEGGMRSIPFAALHDGEQYIVENYSVGMMPSFRLTNTVYQDIRDVELLAMGSDTFEDPALAPLPGVPVEIDIVAQNLWEGKSFLNEEFTVNNLKQTQNSNPFGILHLATHAEFLPGEPANSYIQFGDRKLRLNEIRELGLNNPLVELIVLSACKTAVGDRDAEYGFASLAYQAGVKSALGSLWYVNDSGTLALMSKFYGELKESPIKAEALRRAQVAIIQGKVRLENGKLIAGDFEFDLPPEIPEEKLTHPRYWSPFAIIGNPW